MSADFFVGSYTIKMGHIPDPRGEGITAHTVDLTTGQMTRIGTASTELTGTNPTYMCKGFDDGILYAVSETDDGELRALKHKKEGSEYKFELINSVKALGADPCHVAIHQSTNARHLLSANYSGGNVTIAPINSDNSLGEHSQILTTSGAASGVNPARQEMSHPHMCALVDQKYLLVPNLGADRIQVYEIDENGKVSDEFYSTCNICSPGSGPRHLAFHPSLPFVYFIQELSSTVVVGKIDTSSGLTLTKIQEISTLPEGFSGDNTTAAIRIDAKGKYLYGSNRGHNSICLFEVNSEDGTLKQVSHASTDGDAPRDFCIDKSGRVMVAANQNGHSLISFSISPDSGKLQKLSETFCGSPVAVLFL